MGLKTAVIGGSDAYKLLDSGQFAGEEIGAVDTPFGPSQPVFEIDRGGREMLFLSRHGRSGYSVTAPFINYRANLFALKKLGAARVIAWSGPGAINQNYAIGSFSLPDDILDETRNRPATFFENTGVGFIRMNPVFCPGIVSALTQALEKLELPFSAGGVYAATEGPRLETRAEIGKLKALGCDLVGQTLAPEAFLARELEMCYAPVCYITNYAEGVVEKKYEPGKLFEGLLSPQDKARVEAAVAALPGIVEAAIEEIEDSTYNCVCGKALDRYRATGRMPDSWREWGFENRT